MQKKKIILLISVALVILIIGIVYLLISNRHKDIAIKEMSQEFEIQKESLTDEYSQLNLQYEGYGLRVGNDSLATLLNTERVKIQRVLEELKMTKATDIRRISHLKKELETLRGIMRTFYLSLKFRIKGYSLYHQLLQWQQQQKQKTHLPLLPVWLSWYLFQGSLPYVRPK